MHPLTYKGKKWTKSNILILKRIGGKDFSHCQINTAVTIQQNVWYNCEWIIVYNMNVPLCETMRVCICECQVIDKLYNWDNCFLKYEVLSQCVNWWLI